MNVERCLLAAIPIALFVAGIVTLNLNSAVWAKDGDKINSDSFRMFDITDGNVNTQANFNGNTPANTQANFNGNTPANTQANGNGNTPANTQANGNGNTPANTQANGNGNTPANTQANGNGNFQTDSGNYQITNTGLGSCDSICQKKVVDAMYKMDDVF
jgi:hypothetical protein